MKKVKAAVVGIGNMGHNHARTYFHLDNADLVAACDIDKKRVEEIAKEYKTKAFYDYRQMLDSLPDIDLVSIVVPTKFHKEIACFFLEKNINVLLEKPIADTLDAAKKIISTAKKSNAMFTVGHIERFNPAVIKLKEIIEKDKLGKVLSIIARRVGVFPPNVKDTNVFLDLAVHDIDIINFLLNEKPIKTYKHSSKFHTETNDDAGELFLLYKNSAALIQVNWVTPVKIRSLSVTGTKGYAELDYVSQKLIIHKAKVKKRTDVYSEFLKFSKPTPFFIKIQKEEPLKLEIRSFIECINNNLPPLVSTEDALEALKISLLE